MRFRTIITAYRVIVPTILAALLVVVKVHVCYGPELCLQVAARDHIVRIAGPIGGIFPTEVIFNTARDVAAHEAILGVYQLRCLHPPRSLLVSIVRLRGTPIVARTRLLAAFDEIVIELEQREIFDLALLHVLSLQPSNNTITRTAIQNNEMSASSCREYDPPTSMCAPGNQH